jgi:hypothetical protein
MKTQKERLNLLADQHKLFAEKSEAKLAKMDREKTPVAYDAEKREYNQHIGYEIGMRTAIEILEEEDGDMHKLQKEVEMLNQEIWELELYMDSYSYNVKQKSGRLDRESHQFASRTGYRITSKHKSKINLLED